MTQPTTDPAEFIGPNIIGDDGALRPPPVPLPIITVADPNPLPPVPPPATPDEPPTGVA